MYTLLISLRYAKGLWPYYIGIAGASFLVAITGVAIPFIISNATSLMVDVVQGGHVNISAALWLAAMLFGFDAANAIIRNWGGYLGDVMATRLKAQLSIRYYEHLLVLPLHYYDDELTGSIISRLNRAIHEMSNFVNVFANNFLQMLMTTAITVGIVLFYSWQLAILVLILYPLFMWLAVLASKRWQRYQTEKNREIDIASGRFAEVVTRMKIVKSFVKEGLEKRQFRRRYRRTITLTQQQSRYWHAMDIGRGIVLAAIFFAMYAYIFTMTVSRHFTIPEMVLLVTLINALRAPLFSMSYIVDSFQRAVTGSHDFVAAMMLQPEITDTPDASQLRVSRGGVQFENVEFAYSPSHPILKNINLELRPGHKIAVVGKSGEGKTTLIHLLTRLYEPDKGRIMIDGQDIAGVTQKSLRAQVAVVFQDPALFSGTIRENIAYARPLATKQEVIAAAKVANAHEFIMELDDGYETNIGERGIKLSGGQKQRIAIARASLKDAPILVLDEATSNLDSQTERLVQQALQRLMKGRTTLIIAHRMNTIADADAIVTLQDGRIDEVGAPDELARTKGLYARLLALQGSVAERRTLQSYEITE